MIPGPYSPTVMSWYIEEPNWFEEYCQNYYDIEGYNKFGYHKDTHLDRAGFSKYDYLKGEWCDVDEETVYLYTLYNDTYEQWTRKAIPRR